MNTTPRFQKFFLLLLALASIATFAAPANAQRARGAPEIENFTVTPDVFSPGAELNFTVEGTPRARASVRISGIDRNIPLKEVSEGVYEGSYTLRRSDRTATSSTVRATLSARGQSASDSVRMPWGSGRDRRDAQANPAPAPAAQAGPVITAFGVLPVGRIEPGGELNFTMSGTPGAAAAFTIDGVARDVPMREVRAGQYEGSYTIRRMDNFPAAVSITGALGAEGRVARAALKQPLVADAKPPVISNLSPRNGDTIISGDLVSVSATFDDSGGVGVDPRSVRVLLGGRDITTNATITPQFFTFRADLRPGVYPVEVTASDLAGNAVRQSWRFTVASQAAAPATLPLQVLSHANNAEIGGGGTEIRGRTAPDATVDVQVQGIASLAGFIGITQPILNKSLRADANGNFSFSFQPQYEMPGARYEVSMHATKADQTKDLKLVLFQRK